jgi:hypothetical protein
VRSPRLISLLNAVDTQTVLRFGRHHSDVGGANRFHSTWFKQPVILFLPGVTMAVPTASAHAVVRCCNGFMVKPQSSVSSLFIVAQPRRWLPVRWSSRRNYHVPCRALALQHLPQGPRRLSSSRRKRVSFQPVAVLANQRPVMVVG